MKKGHQNQACAADPVNRTFPEDIRHTMYPGGFSSVIDYSKYFQMFFNSRRGAAFYGYDTP
jgi:hypothetical protein